MKNIILGNMALLIMFFPFLTYSQENSGPKEEFIPYQFLQLSPNMIGEPEFHFDGHTWRPYIMQHSVYCECNRQD